MRSADLPWITGAFGLIGALIGAGASFGAIYIQSWIQDRRAAVRLAAELALEDYKLRMQAAPPGTPFPPATVFIDYQVKIMKLIERGKLTPETLKDLSLEHDKFFDAIKELKAARTAAGKGPLDD